MYHLKTVQSINVYASLACNRERTAHSLLAQRPHLAWTLPLARTSPYLLFCWSSFFLLCSSNCLFRISGLANELAANGPSLPITSHLEGECLSLLVSSAG